MKRSSIFHFFLAGTICLLTWGLTSCDIDDPDISNPGNFKITSFEGQHIEAEFSVDCDNPNGFGFKVKKANLDVSVEDMVMGTVKLNKKIKVKRKSKNTYTIPVSLDLENGALFKLMKLAGKDKVTLRIQGKVRGSVYGFSKSMDVDQSKTIDASLLKGLGEKTEE